MWFATVTEAFTTSAGPGVELVKTVPIEGKKDERSVPSHILLLKYFIFFEVHKCVSH